MLPKICVIPKNALSKSCWALNSIQKSQLVYIAAVTKNLVCVKLCVYHFIAWMGRSLICIIPISLLEVYYWSFFIQCVCPLSIHLCNRVKNTQFDTGGFFVTTTICLSSLGVELGGHKDYQHQDNYTVLKRKNRFTLGLNAAKNTRYVQNCFK